MHHSFHFFELYLSITDDVCNIDEEDTCCGGDDEDDDNNDNKMDVPTIIHPIGGRFWYPMHWVGDYIEFGMHRPHFTIMIDLPSGVATSDTKNVKTHLADGGRTFVVMATYPKIMVEEGLVEFHSKWKEEERGLNFERMKVGMDHRVMSARNELPDHRVPGIFKLPLPYVADPIYKKTWIANKAECRLLHVDLVMASLDLDENKVEGF